MVCLLLVNFAHLSIFRYTIWAYSLRNEIMKNLRQTYHIKAPVELVWQVLTEPKHIKGWGAGPAKMQAKVNTKFTLWGGDIYGKNIRVKKPALLQQDWFAGEWSKASFVSIQLTKERAGTKVTLVHRNIPDKSAPGIRSGWKDYYFGPLTEYVESIV